MKYMPICIHSHTHTYVYTLIHYCPLCVLIIYISTCWHHGIQENIDSYFVLFVSPPSVPVTMTFSRLLFYLEAVRLPPSYLPSREFSASSNSDFIRFPRDSIFAGNTLTGLNVSTIPCNSLSTLHLKVP